MNASKFQSLVRLALCPSAHDGEWQNAAVALFRLCRKRKIEPFNIGAQCIEMPSPVIPFGKYRGRTAHYVVTHDPSYGEWLLYRANRLHPAIKKAIARELRNL